MRNVTTTIVDDLDKTTEGAEVHILCLDGREVEVDLGLENSIMLYELTRPFFDAGKEVSKHRDGNRHRIRAQRAAEAAASVPPELEDLDEDQDEDQDEPQDVPAPKRSVKTGKAAKRVTKVAATPATIRAWWADNPKGLPAWRSSGPIPADVKAARERFEQEG